MYSKCGIIPHILAPNNDIKGNKGLYITAFLSVNQFNGSKLTLFSIFRECLPCF